ncbi:MAG TPA: hypothetical protein VLF93_05380 [Candidatus Saccharimonadales bacterium]|nr:hypothetical protein [Candidatus Saccharimonadales bacterium]
MRSDRDIRLVGEPRDMGRREFLAAALASVAGADAILRTPRWLSQQGLVGAVSPPAETVIFADKLATSVDELIDTSRTTISPIKGERLLPTTSSIVIDLPGQNYATDDNIEALPSLSRLGVRTKARLGNSGDIVPALINDLYDIQDKTNLRRMSMLVDSDSWPFAAQVIQAVSHRIGTQFVFLASSPENIGNIRGFTGLLAREYAKSGYGPSTALNGLVDLVQFHDPFAQYHNRLASSAKIARAQIVAEAQSDVDTRRFAKFMARYNHMRAGQQMRMAYLMVSDALVDEVAAVNAFSHILPLDVLHVGGPHQAHDNIVGNAGAYDAAIKNYLAGKR